VWLAPCTLAALLRATAELWAVPVVATCAIRRDRSLDALALCVLRVAACHACELAAAIGSAFQERAAVAAPLVGLTVVTLTDPIETALIDWALDIVLAGVTCANVSAAGRRWNTRLCARTREMLTAVVDTGAGIAALAGGTIGNATIHAGSEATYDLTMLLVGTFELFTTRHTR
jgi:hypothetical protein